jgi:hypothetical protein
MPWLISFLQSAEELPREDGIISLAIPDKRREYDLLKPISTTADAIDAHLDKRTRHTARTAFLAYFYECTTHSSGKWSGVPHIRDVSFANAFDEAKGLFNKLMESENSAYSDFHAWFFTPASFQLILLELKALGYINLEIIEISETEGCEFFVYLKWTYIMVNQTMQYIKHYNETNGAPFNFRSATHTRNNDWRNDT